MEVRKQRRENRRLSGRTGDTAGSDDSVHMQIIRLDGMKRLLRRFADRP